MNGQELEQFRQSLELLLDRVTDEVNHVWESIHQEIDIAEHESSAPVHLADFASKSADADVLILQSERTLHSQIRAALERIAAGTFGQCLACGGTIATERLEAIPFASVCTECAMADESHSEAASAIDGSIIRLTGFEAIEYAAQEGLTLNKLAGTIDDIVTGLSIAEAEAIADDDADLIWLEVRADEYYGQPRNMEPGCAPIASQRLRAGQRRDELAPGEDGGAASRDRSAIGTPGGGLASGGLAGTNAPDASAEGSELEDAMASGRDDHSGDRVSTDEPQSGRSGGAVGGTPAGKRTRGK